MEEIRKTLDADAKAAAAESGFRGGLNCAQAVVAAFAEECGFDRDTAIKAVCGLGGGVGRLREVCGTVTGASVVLSMLAGDGGKNGVYAAVQRFAAKFRRACGSIVCRELLAGTGATAGGAAEERTGAYYRKRPCAELAALSARLVVETLQEEPGAADDGSR